MPTWHQLGLGWSQHHQTRGGLAIVSTNGFISENHVDRTKSLDKQCPAILICQARNCHPGSSKDGILGVILAEGDDQNTMELLAMDWSLAMAIP